MFRKTLLTVGFTFLACTMCLAQFYPTQYRPANQNWQYLQTPHFELVYASGNDSSAMQMGHILEEQYSSVQDLVGGKLTNFPVILNNYNDRSNGFVTPIHFRSEIELPPIKGKSQNPQTGNWLESVGPHELVHAMQMSNLGDFNIPQLVSLFSPDVARSFHGAIPFGILEGIAVHHETENISPRGGRGNLPFFTNQFDATFSSNQRWSMGQLVQTSTDTRPFNRHYIGGYEFTSWLHDEFGSETTREALDFYMDFPFLGYGVALRHSTGKWPGQLYNQFKEHHEKSLDEKESSRIAELDLPFKGREIRRPKWLTGSTLIFYGSFYNARPGFYRYNLKTSEINRLITTNTVGDFRYDLSHDRSQMIFSYYEADAIYDNTAKAELVRFDFETHQKEQLSKNGRLYAPAFYGDDILALQTKPASSQLVSMAQSGTSATNIDTLLTLGNHEITAVAADPKTQELAVIANKRGMQALWIAGKDELESEMERPPDIAFENGSVFDPEWHPDENKLMFSSDFSGTLQLYEYDLASDEIFKITDAAYNAFEGSYSPSGDRVAFIRQQKNERLPVVLERTNYVGQTIDEESWQSSPSKIDVMQRPVVADSTIAQSQEWETGSYSTDLSWLSPRMILPVFEEISNRDVYKAGIELHSNTLLTDQSYSAEISYLQNRGWYDFTYHNKTFYPGFKARLFSQPSYLSVQPRDSQPFTLLRQERAAALSVPFQYRANQNIYSTTFFFEPEIRKSQIKFHQLRSNGSSSDFANISIANLFGRFNYRLQQNIRDLQPNSGIHMFAELESYLSAGDAVMPVGGNQQLQFNFQRPTAFRGGIFTYMSPFRRWNQSLRLGLMGITQSGVIFDNQSIVSDAFSEPILPGTSNLMSLSTRYTIPLMYVDNGGFLLPLYLSNIYLVAFSDTIIDPVTAGWVERSRGVLGIGIRARFRLSNLAFDLGVGYGFEPSRQNHTFFIGDF